MISGNPADSLDHARATTLTSADLLSVVLGSSITTHTAAEVLASASSSLRRLPSDYTSTLVALRTVRPLCSARRHSVTPQAAFELVRRRVEEELPARPLLASPDAVAHFMAPRLSDLPAEEFHTLTLNTHHFLARDITITRGLLDSAPIDPRAAFRQALAERAGNVVFVHNHPGDPTPSAEDRAVTAQFVSAGYILGVPVRDH
jgi:DNA repair protein RadC